MMKDLSKYAEKTLNFLEYSGLTEEQVGLVCAAVLCSLSSKVETAHKMVDYIDHQARLAAESYGMDGRI